MKHDANLQRIATERAIEGSVKSLSVTRQIGMIQRIVEAKDFANFDQDALDKLDDVLCELMRQSISDDHAEDNALHGAEVSALSGPYGMTTRIYHTAGGR